MAEDQTSGGWIYDSATGTKVDETTALNAQARVLEVKQAATTASTDAAQALQTANSFAGQIAQANTTAGQAVTIAEGAVADVDEIKGPIVTRLSAVETAAGYAPGDATDAAMTNIATQETTEFRGALNAQIVDAGTAENVIADPEVITRRWAGFQPIVVHNTGGRTRGMIEVPAGNNNRAFPLTRNPASDSPAARPVNVSEGQVWEFTAWYRTSADYELASLNYSGMRLGLGTDDSFISRPAGETSLNTEWTKMTGRYTVPAGMTSVQLWVFQSHTAGTIYWADFKMEEVAGAEQRIAGIVKDGTNVSLAVAPSYAPSTAHTWDSTVSLYNGESGVMRQVRALIRRGMQGQDVRIVAQGPSTTAGTGAEQPMVAVNSYPAHLADFLGARPGVIPASQWDTRWTPTGMGERSAMNTMGFSASSAGWSLEFDSLGDSFTEFTLYTYRASFADLAVSIDGGPDITQQVLGGSSWKAFHVDGLADTPHTIRITSPVTGWLFGAIDLHQGGLTISNFGRPSSAAGDWLPTGGTSDWSQLYGMAFSAFPGSSALPRPDIALLQPMLNSSTSADTRQVIENVVNLGVLPVLVTSGGVGAMTGGSSVPAQLATMYAAADEFDLPLIDLTHAIGWYAAASSKSLMSDAVHPNRAGYAAQAWRVYRALLG